MRFKGVARGVVAAIALASCYGARAQTVVDGPTKYFGHNVEIHQSKSESYILQLDVDGHVMVEKSHLYLHEVAIVNGAGVVIGLSSGGGTACAGSPFILSFPKNSPPKFDGPIETCVDGMVPEISETEIKFQYGASRGSPGRVWVWTPESGIRDVATIDFKPDETKGWSDLRSRRISHPAELYESAEIAREMTRLLGPNSEKFAELTGTGSVKFEGDAFVGTACMPHNCADTGVLIVADIPAKKLYLAWKTNDKPIATRPQLSTWSESAKRQFGIWVDPSWKKRKSSDAKLRK
jgi:hypothetical protein